jgi:predicted small secreted protein
MSKKRSVIIMLLAIIVANLAAACNTGTAGGGGQELAMAPMEHMPADVQSAPLAVQQAYQFALANPDVLKKIPCYCGCDNLGHTSNYLCYVAGIEADGSTRYDPHALGCSICVDITQDTMRLLREGRSLPDIKLYVANTYDRFGTSTGSE